MKRFIKMATGLATIIALSLSMNMVIFASEGEIMVNGYIGDRSSVVKYHIAYDANGGTGGYVGVDITPGEAEVILSVDETGIIREGYTFTEWNTAPDGSGTSYRSSDTIILNSNVTFYAQWEGKLQSDGPVDTAGTGTPSSGDVNSSLVQTGDTSNISLWIYIFGISSTVLVFLLWMYRWNKLNVKKVK